MTFDIARYVARIDANRSIKDELVARLTAARPRRSISVTDLVNPRKAYMQRIYPDIQPPLERKEAMMAGKGFHDLFGHMVSSEEYLEQYVQWDGIVGIIDVYKDVPTELKTTSGVDGGGDLRVTRASYVEQLAMYCAMVDRKRGRLILYGRGSTEREPRLTVYDAIFDELDSIRDEMSRRRDCLVQALEKQSPDGLPACPWFGRGCEFEAVCACDKAASFVPSIAAKCPPLEERPEEAENLLSMIAAARPAKRRGLNDLVFPRKAYYDRLRKDEETDADRLESMDKSGRRKALADAMSFGRGKDSVRKPLALGEVQDQVTFYRDVPTLLRTSKLNEVIGREGLTRMFPHYFLRLAFECALVGSPRGRLVLDYEKLAGDSKIMVYDVIFDDMEGLVKEAENRLLIIREVNEGRRDPKELPPCPAWMRKYCKYQPSCGC